MIRKYAYVALVFTLALDSASSARVKIGGLVHENGSTLARASQAGAPLLDKARDVQHVQGLEQQPNSTHADNTAALDTITGSISDPTVVDREQGVNGSGLQGKVSIGAMPMSAMIALSAATTRVASTFSTTGLEMVGRANSSSKSLSIFVVVACIIVICCCLGSLGSPDPSQEGQHDQAHGKQRGSVDSTGKAPSGDSPPALTASWLSVNRERGSGEADGDSSGGESAAESVRSWTSGGGSKSLASSFASASGGERKRDKVMSFVVDKVKTKAITKAAKEGAEARGEDPADGYKFGDVTRGLLSKAARHTRHEHTIDETRRHD